MNTISTSGLQSALGKMLTRLGKRLSAIGMQTDVFADGAVVGINARVIGRRGTTVEWSGYWQDFAKMAPTQIGSIEQCLFESGLEAMAKPRVFQGNT
jgi:hypothetical protein